MADPLLVVRREGGREPSDDESLEVHDDGSFRMWRTVGWQRAGLFAGALPADALADLRRAVDAAPAEATDAGAPRGAATEQHVTPRGRVSLGGSDDPAPAWAELVAVGRRLVDELTGSPQAALDLAVVSEHEASLAVVGERPLPVAPPSLRWRVERLDRDGVPLAGWRPPGDEGEGPPEHVSTSELEPHPPGTFRTLLLGHGWDLAPDEILRVWVTIAIARPPETGAPLGPAKTARLVAIREQPPGS